MSDSERKYINTIQAAAYLGFTKGALEIMRIRGNGPKFHKLGYRTVRYTYAELDQWAEELQFSSTSEYQSSPQ